MQAAHAIWRGPDESLHARPSQHTLQDSHTPAPPSPPPHPPPCPRVLSWTRCSDGNGRDSGIRKTVRPGVAHPAWRRRQPRARVQVVGGTPLFIARGRGAYIEDADGNTYIDYVMSWGPLIHGHAPKGPAEGARGRGGAARASARRPSSRRAGTAGRDAGAVDGARAFRQLRDRSGDERLRVARAATRRDRIIKFEGCYHGHADAFLVQAGSGAMTLGVPTSPGVPRPRRAIRCSRATTISSRWKRCSTQNRGQIAAVFVEPIAGNMGVVVPRADFSKACARSAIARTRCWSSMR